VALSLRLGKNEAVPERLVITATVTLNEAGSVPTIVWSHFDVTAGVRDSPRHLRHGGRRSQRAVPGLPAVRRGEDHRRRHAGISTVTTGAAVALALPQPVEASLAAVLATAVWVGSLVVTFVMAGAAHATLGRRSGWRSSARWAAHTGWPAATWPRPVLRAPGGPAAGPGW
jgi:hypothetical protein